jgi:hypothetical protein
MQAHLAPCANQLKRKIRLDTGLSISQKVRKKTK